MHFKLIRDRIYGLLILPNDTWRRMRAESGYALETLTLLFACCALCGLASRLSGRDDSWAPETFVLFTAFMLLSVVMRALSPAMRRVNWEGSLNLLVYSGCAGLLLYALSLLAGHRVYLLPAGVASGLVWLALGLRQMLGLRWAEGLAYTLATFLALGVCLYWARVLLSA